MADGQISLARTFTQGPSSTISVAKVAIARVELHRNCFGDGSVRRGHHCCVQNSLRFHRRLHHRLEQERQQHHRQQKNRQTRQEHQQQEKRVGGGLGSGRRSGGLCRLMASAAEGDPSSTSSASSKAAAAAAAADPYRRFQSYSVPAENWRAKKQGGHTHQGEEARGGDLPQQVNGRASGTSSSILHPMPRDTPEDCQANAAKLESTAHSLRPTRIILVRHGQSEGNVDESAYTRIPDSKISLTEEGWKQAIQCGKRIREIIEKDKVDDWKVYFYVSPYRRTLQTLRGIGLAFERDRIAGVREEPRIREQDFGNFQDREKMRVEKEVRLRYGRFFYRFPNGESAADVYDRITGFRETLRADVDVGRFQRPESRSKNMNLVMVSHGLTLRVFLMRWYKWTVEQFEGLWNFGNTGMMVMELGPGGRYSLTMHHSAADLKAFGMTDDMIADQEWQKYAKPGELNYDWLTSGSSFFTHYDDLKSGRPCDEIPPDIMRSVLGIGGELHPEPPQMSEDLCNQEVAILWPTRKRCRVH